MSEPKCSKCGSNEYVHLVSTFTKTGTVVGAAAGASGTVGGAATGAAAGAALCSFVPVVGTTIGAIGGAHSWGPRRGNAWRGYRIWCRQARR